ncbi:MAG: CDP-alcohol phosphatidyltransferase family protein [Gammaproteobacteria bacterium]|nr:CDP-alcohol phosphatidyltransferase family protein [Gammaproteobacteria bacterium]MCW9006028.1 CDP-alcohol phosphatidyltransferase family protein [Gammaproteobacteria bacterium]MCW9057206.1 CDP-alcohol phosphatidyltransferase family protein [Gammaproteobacteria bacterium]
MKINNQEIYNWPNFVSLVRILLAPFMLFLAIQQEPAWFIVVLLLSEFTDVLDGFLARYLNQITDLGSHLDSWGDFCVYSVLAVSAWLLWPEIVIQEIVYVAVIIISFTLPVLIGFIKFRTITSYHTWSVKIAVAVTVISYILLFLDISPWPFRLASLVCAYAALEEIAITLMIEHLHVDVRSLRQALNYRKHNS